MFDALRRKITTWFGSQPPTAYQPPVLPSNASLTDQCLFLYSTIDWSIFEKYQRVNSRGMYIVTLHPTIDDMQRDIIDHTLSMHNTGTVLDFKCRQYLEHQRSITLNNFLLSNDGSYFTSVQKVLFEFSEHVIALCQTLNTSQHPDHDTRQYNQRMLSALLTSLLDIGLALEEISLRIKQ